MARSAMAAFLAVVAILSSSMVSGHVVTTTPPLNARGAVVDEPDMLRMEGEDGYIIRTEVMGECGTGDFSLQGATVDIPGATAQACGLFQLAWRVDQAAEEIEFQMFAKTSGWLAMGIQDPENPKLLDTYVGSVVQGQGKIIDGTTDGLTAPVPDTTNHAEVTYAHQNYRGTTLKFKRKLKTGDDDQDVDITDQQYLVAWAVHFMTDDIDAPVPLHEYRGLFKLSFFGGTANTKLLNAPVLFQHANVPTAGTSKAGALSPPRTGPQVQSVDEERQMRTQAMAPGSALDNHRRMRAQWNDRGGDPATCAACACDENGQRNVVTENKRRLLELQQSSRRLSFHKLAPPVPNCALCTPCTPANPIPAPNPPPAAYCAGIDEFGEPNIVKNGDTVTVGIVNNNGGDDDVPAAAARRMLALTPSSRTLLGAWDGGNEPVVNPNCPCGRSAVVNNQKALCNECEPNGLPPAAIPPPVRTDFEVRRLCEGVEVQAAADLTATSLNQGTLLQTVPYGQSASQDVTVNIPEESWGDKTEMKCVVGVVYDTTTAKNSVCYDLLVKRDPTPVTDPLSPTDPLDPTVTDPLNPGANPGATTPAKPPTTVITEPETSDDAITNPQLPTDRTDDTTITKTGGERKTQAEIDAMTPAEREAYLKGQRPQSKDGNVANSNGDTTDDEDDNTMAITVGAVIAGIIAACLFSMCVMKKRKDAMNGQVYREALSMANYDSGLVLEDQAPQMREATEAATLKGVNEEEFVGKPAEPSAISHARSALVVESSSEAESTSEEEPVESSSSEEEVEEAVESSSDEEAAPPVPPRPAAVGVGAAGTQAKATTAAGAGGGGDAPAPAALAIAEGGGGDAPAPAALAIAEGGGGGTMKRKPKMQAPKLSRTAKFGAAPTLQRAAAAAGGGSGDAATTSVSAASGGGSGAAATTSVSAASGGGSGAATTTSVSAASGGGSGAAAAGMSVAAGSGGGGGAAQQGTTVSGGMGGGGGDAATMSVSAASGGGSGAAATTSVSAASGGGDGAAAAGMSVAAGSGGGSGAAQQGTTLAGGMGGGGGTARRKSRTRGRGSVMRPRGRGSSSMSVLPPQEFQHNQDANMLVPVIPMQHAELLHSMMAKRESVDVAGAVDASIAEKKAKLDEAK